MGNAPSKLIFLKIGFQFQKPRQKKTVPVCNGWEPGLRITFFVERVHLQTSKAIQGYKACFTIILMFSFSLGTKVIPVATC